MHKKIISFTFSLLGFVSLFLPYNKVVITACGENFRSRDYYYDSLIRFIPDFFSTLPRLNNLIETLLILLVCFSLIFSSILFLLNKITTSILLVIVTLLIMSISFYNLHDDLGFGYYVIIFQQIALLFYIIYAKNKFKIN
ncbi:hypothetical protein C8C83_2024 [Flavobacterium sp. 90]|nr:hypothetical protein C8C82_2327 [Flavobacterium sp. 81]TCK54135.1 hypothetical protein C8C83_2024 [Flavobacterium sp. 90]